MRWPTKTHNADATHLWVIVANQIGKLSGADSWTGNGQYDVVLLYGEDVKRQKELTIPFDLLEDFLRGLQRAASHSQSS